MSLERTRFPGAQPFSDDWLSRKLFFGRKKESLALRNQVLANRLTVLFARSGLGKTSLINAGMSEGLLKEGMLPLPVRVNDTRGDALASIYSGIEKYCKSHDIEHVPASTDSLWLYFKTVQFWQDERLLTPVLILDQFEEIFTLRSGEERESFVKEFSHLVRGVRPSSGAAAAPAVGPSEPAVSDSPPRVHILIAIREDFLANLEEFSDRIPEILSERFRLVPFARPQAEEALVAPTQVDDPELVTRPFLIAEACQRAVLDFLEQRSPAAARRSAFTIEPFQLQLLCQHIEEVARNLQSGQPDQQAAIGLKEIGGAKRLGRVLRTFYRSQLRSIPFLQRSKVRRLCAEHLVTPHGRRVRMEESEIQRICDVKPATLRALVDKRIIRRDQTAEGDYYELSHDSLIGPVVNARRSWFIIKMLNLAAVLVFAVVYGVVFAVGTFGYILNFLESEGEAYELLLVPVLLAAALLFFYGACRIFRSARDYLRRSRL